MDGTTVENTAPTPRKAVLPPWATAIGPGRVEVDAEGFYAQYMGELGVTEKTFNCYWREVCSVFMQLDMQLATYKTDLSPKAGGALTIIVRDKTKTATEMSKFNPKRWPETERVDAWNRAVKGKEGREHYKRLRGFIPAGPG